MNDNELFEKARRRVQKKIKGRCATNKDVIVDQEKEIEQYRNKIRKLIDVIENKEEHSKTNCVEIEVNLEVEKTINKLEKIKSLLKDINEIDSELKLNNVINVKKDSVLIVTTDNFYCKKTIDIIEDDLRKRIGIRCVVLPTGTEINKVIDFGVDCSQEKDYTTTAYYSDEEKLLKEEVIQYK